WFELVFYICQTDYELKVLIHRTFSDSANRSVWEKYLGLCVHETIEALPRVLGAVHRAADSDKGLDDGRVRQTSRAYNDAIKAIKADKVFMDGLQMIRNSVAAHHVGKAEAGLTVAIEWMLTSWRSADNGLTPMNSQIVEYAVVLGRAVQDLGQGLQKARG
ncbi:MAG: hypothetical protein FWG16_08035, partial [Micrococcales bacterium]|nr:hypothetical protein [Micrococcales bacterium]